MATLTITVPDSRLPLIDAVIAEYNAAHGTNLNRTQWAKAILAREILKNEVSDAMFAQVKAAEKALAAAVVTAENNVLGTL